MVPVKMANTRYRGGVRLFNSHAKFTVRVSTRFTTLFLAARTCTVATAFKKVTMNTHFHP